MLEANFLTAAAAAAGEPSLTRKHTTTDHQEQARIRGGLSPISQNVIFPAASGRSHLELLGHLRHLLADYGAGEVLLVGASSGGFMAAQCGDHPAVGGVVALASALLPYTRAARVSGKRPGTFKHFEDASKVHAPRGMEWSEANCPRCSQAEEELVRAGCGAPIMAVVGNGDEALPPSVWGLPRYQNAMNGGAAPVLVTTSPPSEWSLEEHRGAMSRGCMLVTDRTHSAIYKAPKPVLEAIVDWWIQAQLT